MNTKGTLMNNAEKAYSDFRKRAGGGRVWAELPEADRADWELIAPLADNGVMFDQEAMGTQIVQRAAELGIPRKSLDHIIYRFWMESEETEAVNSCIKFGYGR